MQQSPILIVDDEQAILHMLETILKKEGFTQIDTATTAEKAIQLCQRRAYAIILLDVMLPGEDGFEVCPKIRAISNATIFFLTARTTDLDKLSGFAVGADDYITKPFNPLEVVARMKAHLRRKQGDIPAPQTTTYTYGNLVVDTLSAEVSLAGEKVNLQAQVYNLLLFFCQHPNQVFSKSQLYEQVWGDQYLGEDNTVMVHIRKLREQIEQNPSRPKSIVTVRGLGYKFVPTGGTNENL
ncbi:transcriptional regulatory protein WalR [Paraliobacillus ryukyuensis]|uniref:DNA-binding response OmpR family regulator n=1 Tax=Paraliobacillus ryukyuensis TaxID=200904 RepID=A0A366DSS2_9BACI|nr:response regulator transcription factor [Paraliobacillus ryukyuensis]RBO93147.1 DNA-binding response OmpR family regulator [Paraliobacillus ryukyuensis]